MTLSIINNVSFQQKKTFCKTLRIPKEAARLMTDTLVQHWHSCSMYTIGKRHIVKKICGIHNEFQCNFQTRNERKTEEWMRVHGDNTTSEDDTE